jgi:acyl transferase domain-containing protein
VDDSLVLSSMRRDGEEVAAVVGSLAQLYVRGGSVDWGALFGPRRRVDLPTYAFQRQRYWLNSSRTAVAVETPSTDLPADGADLISLSDMVSALSDDGDAEELVLSHVLQKIAVVLGHPSSETIDPDQELMGIGFDSLLSMRLSKSLAASTGLELRANLTLRHRSPRRIAAHITSAMAKRAPG